MILFCSQIATTSMFVRKVNFEEKISKDTTMQRTGSKDKMRRRWIFSSFEKWYQKINWGKQKCFSFFNFFKFLHFFPFLLSLKIWYRTQIFTWVTLYKDWSTIYWYDVPNFSWKSKTCKNGLLTHFLEDMCIKWED